MSNATPYIDSGEQLAVIFDASFEEWLAWISPENLARAWTTMKAGLEGSGLTTDHLRFGWLHPGVAQVSQRRNSPFAYLGWIGLTASGHTEAWLNNTVNRMSPSRLPLCFGASYRTGAFECDPSDGDSMLRAASEYALDEISDWSPEFLLDGGDLSSELAHVFEALTAKNAARVSIAVEEMRPRCSLHGHAILTRGIALWQGFSNF